MKRNDEPRSRAANRENALQISARVIAAISEAYLCDEWLMMAQRSYDEYEPTLFNHVIAMSNGPKQGERNVVIGPMIG